MKRVHLFEFEDQEWFPNFLRNYMTDFLQFASNKGNIYNSIVPLLAAQLKRDKTNVIIDIGSGGGGGLIALNTELRQEIPDLRIMLTDLYPNKSAFQFTSKAAENFEFVETPVDARNIPKHLKGLRTQFLSLHHFKPVDAKAILQNAIDSNSSIAIFEAQERSIKSIIGMLLSPLSVLLLTPFIRPFKWGRLLFTYPIPIIPLFTLWDGIVSVLRTYSVEEMKDLVEQLDGAESYDWNIGKKEAKLGVVLYLIGAKK
ncbi:MAG: hypothetical protein AAF705_08075 [Bacteroidota bacterium]